MKKGHHRDARGVIALQQMARSAKQCVAIIALSVMYDQFGVTDPEELRVFYDTFKYESDHVLSWTPRGIERAESLLKEHAPTYVERKKIRPDEKMMGKGRDTDQVILNSEATCLYLALLVLRRNFRATYKQLDAFLDRYMDFCEVYEDGEQTSLRELSDQLEEITGIRILGKDI